MKSKTTGSIVCLKPNSKLPLTNKRLRKHVLKEIERLSSIKNPASEALDDIEDLTAAAKFLAEDNGISWKDSKVEFLEDLALTEEIREEGEFIDWEEVKASPNYEKSKSGRPKKEETEKRSKK